MHHWNLRVHRPLYDWILEHLELPRALPKQYEFAKLIPSHTIVSKRWSDFAGLQRVVTGLRRSAIADHQRHPAARGDGGPPCAPLPSASASPSTSAWFDVAVYDHAVRDDLNRRSLRRLAVLRPLKVVIMNYPEGQTEEFEAVNNPEDEAAGKRKIPFRRELFIERDDFAETPPPKFFRLKPGGEVRLKYAFIIKCEEVVKDVSGNLVELRCTADLDSRTGGPTASRKIKGTVHWVSAAQAIEAEVRLYDRLFTEAEPEKDGRDFKSVLNPHSLEVVTAKCEPGLKTASPVERYQFERLAYFVLDKDSTPEKPVFNRTITLRDTWAREGAKAQ